MRENQQVWERERNAATRKQRRREEELRRRRERERNVCEREPSRVGCSCCPFIVIK
jgi:hypothetical protein